MTDGVRDKTPDPILPPKLVAFLYLLMRDQMPTGDVAGILQNHIRKLPTEGWIFTNRHLEAYAREIAAELVAS